MREASARIAAQWCSSSRALPARFDAGWNARDTFSCLTGNAQLAIVWLKLSALDQDTRFTDAALSLLEQVKAAQSLDAAHPGIRGGIPGSHPVWGGYVPFACVNWAAKFFVDALLLKRELHLH